MRTKVTTALAVLAFAIAGSVSAQQVKVGSVCKDGTTDKVVGRGACSRHGGVDKDATAKAEAAAKASAASAAKASAGAMVTCKDGSTSKPGRGACSGHGGVGAAAAVPAPAAAKAAPTAKVPKAAPAAAAPSVASGTGGGVDNNAAGATAKCKDGAYSHSKSHKGACSRHGGVAQWL